MADHSIGDVSGLENLCLKVTVNPTHGVIFHPLHQSLDLAHKFPEKERKSVLWGNSAWSFPPKGA